MEGENLCLPHVHHGTCPTVWGRGKGERDILESNRGLAYTTGSETLGLTPLVAIIVPHLQSRNHPCIFSVHISLSQTFGLIQNYHIPRVLWGTPFTFSRSFPSAATNFVPFYGWVVFQCVNKPHLTTPPYDSHCAFDFMAIMNGTSKSICTHASTQTCFQSSGPICQSGLYGWNGSSMFNFLRICQSVSQSRCAILNFHLQRVPISACFHGSCYCLSFW